MIEDNGQHIIISSSYGNYSGHPCTVENARALLTQHEAALAQEVRDLALLPENTYHILNAELLVRALRDVMALDEGAPSISLRAMLHGRGPRRGEEDLRPPAAVSSELKTEVTLWCVQNKVNPLNISGLDAKKLNEVWTPSSGLIQSALKARIEGLTPLFVDEWVLDTYAEYHQLTKGKWKETAKEHAVVDRYLQFITENLTHRDVKYFVAGFSAKV